MLVPERGSFGSGSTLFKEGVLGEVSSKGFVALLYVWCSSVVLFILYCVVSFDYCSPWRQEAGWEAGRCNN